MEGTDFEKKYFYVTLQEEDGEYEGIIGIGLNEALTQYNERKKILKNGNFFEGEFKNDKIEGKGILKFVDGNVYEGDSKKKIEGKGILKFIDGRLYEGDFKNEKVEGKGIMNSYFGDVYEGDFKKNKFEGKVGQFSTGIFKLKTQTGYQQSLEKLKKNIQII